MTRFVRTVTVGLLGLAGLLVVLAGALVLTSPGQTVQGEVVASGGNPEGCYPTVAYTVDDTTYRTTAPRRARWCALEMGGTATVHYAPSSPEDGRLDRYGSAPTRLLAGAVASIAAAGLALVAGRRAARRAAPTPVDAGPLPASATLLAASCLALVALDLLDHGQKTNDQGLVLSVLVGAALVGWFSAGVLQARTFRTTVVAVLLSGVVLVEVGPLLDAVTAMETLRALGGVALTLLPLAALAWYTTTSRFAWQRLHPGATAPGTAGLVLIAVLAGVLGGLAAPDPDSRFSVQVTL